MESTTEGTQIINYNQLAVFRMLDRFWKVCEVKLVTMSLFIVILIDLSSLFILIHHVAFTNGYHLVQYH